MVQFLTGPNGICFVPTLSVLILRMLQNVINLLKHHQIKQIFNNVCEQLSFQFCGHGFCMGLVFTLITDWQKVSLYVIVVYVLCKIYWSLSVLCPSRLHLVSRGSEQWPCSSQSVEVSSPEQFLSLSVQGRGVPHSQICRGSLCKHSRVSHFYWQTHSHVFYN